MPDLASQLPHQLPLFFRLKPAEMKQFMEICKKTTCDSGELLCEYGTASRRFYILLEGELEVIGKDGTVLARMRPVTTVGEMGFIGELPMVVETTKRDNGTLEITLVREANPQDLLEALLGHVEIERFEVKTPKLREIFVQLVGADHG